MSRDLHPLDADDADVVGAGLQRKVLDEVEHIGRRHDGHAEVEILDPQTLGVGTQFTCIGHVV